MDYWRRATKRSRPKHVPNDRKREIMGVSHTIIGGISVQQLACY